MQLDINNPLINHAALSQESAAFKYQNKMNNLFKLNIKKISKKEKNKNFILDKFYQMKIY